MAHDCCSDGTNVRRFVEMFAGPALGYRCPVHGWQSVPKEPKGSMAALTLVLDSLIMETLTERDPWLADFYNQMRQALDFVRWQATSLEQAQEASRKAREP